RDLARWRDHWLDRARRRKLAYALDTEIDIHWIAASCRMVIEEDVVPVGPEAWLCAQERPDLVERRPPNCADAANRDFAAHCCQNPWRNDLNRNAHVHGSPLLEVFDLAEFAPAGSQDRTTWLPCL